MKKKIAAVALAAAIGMSQVSAAALEPVVNGAVKNTWFFSSFEGGSLKTETTN